MFPAYHESELASLYPGVEFGQFVSIGADVQIGSGSRIGAGCRLYPGTLIGKGVTILENTVIGRPTVLPPISLTVKRQIADGVSPAKIDDGTVVGASVVLYRGVHLGFNNIICDLTSIREDCVLGSDVLLGRGVMLQVNTKVGARTKIMDTCHLPGDMVIEEDVFLSTHVCGASENSLGREDRTGEWSGPYICRKAYVGVNATLLPGIKVGENAVVGAGSVVTKDVAPFSLVMGVPARYVREVPPKL
jgi:acetyltransferase-like isoleucine patch superfamily enzyme